MKRSLQNPRVLTALFLMFAVTALNLLARWEGQSHSALIWLLPILLLRLFRMNSGFVWIAGTAVLLVLENILTARLSGLSDATGTVFIGLFTLLSFLPYELDRRLVRKTNSQTDQFFSTLLFPAAGVLLAFAVSKSAGALYMTPFLFNGDNPVLLQTASFAGNLLVLFLVLWPAPLINNYFDDRSKTNRANLFAFLFIFIATSAYGIFQISRELPYSNVRLSIIDNQFESPEFYSGQMAVTDLPPEMEEVYEAVPFMRAGYATLQGGELLTWTKGFSVDTRSFEDFIDSAQKLARKSNAYIFFPLISNESSLRGDHEDNQKQDNPKLYFVGIDNRGKRLSVQLSTEGPLFAHTPYGAVQYVRLDELMKIKKTEAGLLVVVHDQENGYMPQSLAILRGIELGTNIVFQMDDRIQMYSGRGRLLHDESMTDENNKTATFMVPLQEFGSFPGAVSFVALVIFVLFLGAIARSIRILKQEQKS